MHFINLSGYLAASVQIKPVDTFFHNSGNIPAIKPSQRRQILLRGQLMIKFNCLFILLNELMLSG